MNPRTIKPDDPYAGRWVARLRGRIIAQGGTPEQARQAARSRFKETAEIQFQPLTAPPLFPPLLIQIRSILPEKQEIFLVGGAVRDLMLGREVHDYDFTVKNDGIKTARWVANGLEADFYPLDDERDTGRVVFTTDGGERLLLDFAAFRGDTIDKDLMGRDFSVNAIAIDLRTEAIYDPLGGQQDLEKKVLEVCSPTALVDDPVRVLRAIRLAAEYGFRIHPETRKLLKSGARGLSSVSGERCRDEIFRILEGNNPSACIRALEMVGVVEILLPELTALKGLLQPKPHVSDGWEHTLALLDELRVILDSLAPTPAQNLSENVWRASLALRVGKYRNQINEHLGMSFSAGHTWRGVLFLAGLYHDVAKPLVSQVDENGKLRFWEHDKKGSEIALERGRALVLSNDELDQLGTIVKNHMRLLFHFHKYHTDGIRPSRKAIYRFFKDNGAAGVDLCLLALADLRATYGPALHEDLWLAALDVVRLFLENWYEKPAESIHPPTLVDGNDLMDTCQLQPGPRVGELLEAIREAQAMGKITSREQALLYARDIVSENIDQENEE